MLSPEQKKVQFGFSKGSFSLLFLPPCALEPASCLVSKSFSTSQAWKVFPSAATACQLASLAGLSPSCLTAGGRRGGDSRPGLAAGMNERRAARLLVLVNSRPVFLPLHCQRAREQRGQISLPASGHQRGSVVQWVRCWVSLPVWPALCTPCWVDTAPSARDLPPVLVTSQGRELIAHRCRWCRGLIGRKGSS